MYDLLFKKLLSLMFKNPTDNPINFEVARVYYIEDFAKTSLETISEEGIYYQFQQTIIDKFQAYCPTGYFITLNKMDTFNPYDYIEIVEV